MKSRPLPIIVSPTSLILKERSHSYAEKERSQARLRVPEIKSVLIARKLNNEDLYGSSLKIRSPSELSQIKEEKLDKSETLSNVDIAESQVVYQEPKVFKSMFQTDTLGSPKFKEHGIGPQYKNNKIIKHSIVGSSDGFEKYQKSLQKIHLHSMRSQDLDNNSDMVMSRLHKMSSSIILKDENNPNATLLSRRPSVKPKPKDSKKETKISKENIIDKIEEMKRQQESFYKTQAIGYSRLPLDEKLNQTKEERRLQSFNNTMEDWQKMTTDIAKKAGRTPESSVMSRNESFRGKREITDLLEEGKTDSEQLGNHFWHVTLRKYGEDYEKGNHCSVIRDFPQGFNSKQLNKTLSHFQVIRSPSKISGAEYTTKSIDKTKKIDRTYNEYLESKFAKLGKLIKKIKPTDMDQVSTLMVQGKNKLDMEATLVQKEEEDEDGFYVPQAFLQSKNEEKVDQTITEFYERTMTSKKGHSAYI